MLAEIERARAFIGTNSDWEPIVREFDGVAMALVPVGCFTMGSNTARDEQPVHEQCFTEPFWIDVTEVTQAQFARFNGARASASAYDGDDHPVEYITWFEAQAFCALRGGRLPTEREWEFAARGPASMAYPWGEAWVAANAVFNRRAAANVGQVPAGASWVGALDLAGNQSEWVNSLYQTYPYSADDGREAATRAGDRVLRGGSWSDSNNANLRAANRNWSSPGLIDVNVGLRCARSG